MLPTTDPIASIRCDLIHRSAIRFAVFRRGSSLGPTFPVPVGSRSPNVCTAGLRSMRPARRPCRGSNAQGLPSQPLSVRWCVNCRYARRQVTVDASPLLALQAAPHATREQQPVEGTLLRAQHVVGCAGRATFPRGPVAASTVATDRVEEF